MANNYVRDGGTLEFIASSATLSGTAVMVGEVAAVAINNVATGEVCTAQTVGVFALPKGAGTIAQGVKVYLTPAGQASTTSSGNKLAGKSWEAASDADATVQVKLN